MKKRRLLIIIIFAVCLLGVLLTNNLMQISQAATSDEIRDQIDELKEQQSQMQAQINELEKQRAENEDKLTQLISDKLILDQQIALINQQVLNTNQQLNALKMLIADKQDEYDLAEAEHKALNEKFIDRIRVMEEQGELSYWSILFRSNTFSEFLDRMNMVSEIAAADHEKLIQLRNSAKRVAAARDALETEQAAMQATLRELRAQEDALAGKRAEADVLIRELSALGAEFDTLLDQSEQAQQELLLQIAKKEDEFDQAEYQEWLATYVPPTTKPAPTTVPTTAPTTAPTEGSATTPTTKPTEPKPTEPKPTEPQKPAITWKVPVPYYTLTSPFGMRMHPVYNEMRMHNGIDMACAEGTPIYASRGGQVEIAVYSSTAGNYVQLNHGDGYRSVYMHMTHYIVKSGQYVAQGQVIGYVGNTGVSKGNHLHFGVSYKGTYINPYPLIS